MSSSLSNIKESRTPSPKLSPRGAGAPDQGSNSKGNIYAAASSSGLMRTPSLIKERSVNRELDEETKQIQMELSGQLGAVSSQQSAF